MKILLAALLIASATETAPYSGAFCSYGADSEGYESYSFTIREGAYADDEMTCKSNSVEAIGDGWHRIMQTCPDGQENLEIKVLGDNAIVILEDGHEYSLKRCP